MQLSCAAQYKRNYHKEEAAPPLWPTKLVDWETAPSHYTLQEGFAFCLFLQHSHPDLTKRYTFEKNMYRKKLHLEAITAAEEEMSRLVAEKEVKLASSTSEQNSADESEDIFGGRLDVEGQVGGKKRDRSKRSIDEEDDTDKDDGEMEGGGGDEDDDEMEGGGGVQSKMKRQKLKKGVLHGRDDEDLQDEGDEDEGDEGSGDADPPKRGRQAKDDYETEEDDGFRRKRRGRNRKKAITGAGGGEKNKSKQRVGKEKGTKKKSTGKDGIAGGVRKKKLVIR